LPLRREASQHARLLHSRVAPTTMPADPNPLLPTLDRGIAARARTLRVAVFAAAASLLVLAFALHGPIAQFADYHAFADARALGALPNAANVLSNLAFAVAALAGLWKLRAGRRADRSVWTLFALALFATAVGSTIYHLAPSDTTLVADRLPIAWACAMLGAAFLGERLDRRWRSPAALAAGFWIATASVLVWWFGQRAGGSGDLRPYLFLQVAPMLLIPIALLLRLRAPAAVALPDAAWWGTLALYALAKVVELRDGAIYAAHGLLSGHTLKHLLAAAAAWVLHAAAARISSGSRR
jgi:hypothetical protein